MKRTVLLIVLAGAICLAAGYYLRDRFVPDRRLDRLIVAVHDLAEMQYGMAKRSTLDRESSPLQRLLTELDDLRSTTGLPSATWKRTAGPAR